MCLRCECAIVHMLEYCKTAPQNFSRKTVCSHSVLKGTVSRDFWPLDYFACSVFPKALILGLKRFWKQFEFADILDYEVVRSSLGQLQKNFRSCPIPLGNFLELSNTTPKKFSELSKIFKLFFLKKLCFPFIIKGTVAYSFYPKKLILGLKLFFLKMEFAKIFVVEVVRSSIESIRKFFPTSLDPKSFCLSLTYPAQ